MRWLREACQDDETGRYSSTRITLIVSTLTLSICTIVLTIAVLFDAELIPALSIFGGGLAGMSGGAYMANRFARPRFTDRGIVE